MLIRVPDRLVVGICGFCCSKEDAASVNSSRPHRNLERLSVQLLQSKHPLRESTVVRDQVVTSFWTGFTISTFIYVLGRINPGMVPATRKGTGNRMIGGLVLL